MLKVKDNERTEQLVPVGASWAIGPGPVGRGACLAAEDPTGGVHYIAPPGVALQPLEEVGPLRHWRIATWRFGAPQDGVSELSLQEVEERVSAHRAWIQEQEREAEALEAMLDRAHGATAADANAVSFTSPTSAADVPVAALLPDERPVAAVTHSASTYAALTLYLPPGSAVTRVETFVCSAVSASHLAAELDTLALSNGHPAVRELVASLLHARSRSHSWRYTRPIGRIEHRSTRERRVTRIVDRSYSARELLQRVEAEGLLGPELDEILVNLLYAQNHGLRWKLTYPLRRILGSPRLNAARRLLRRHVQPRVALLRLKRSPHVGALPPAGF